jgi:Tfp pilus assembly protein PilW
MLLMVIGSLVTVFLSVQRTQVFTQERSQSLDEMRLAIDRLTKEARQATTLDDSSNASRLDMQTFVNGVSTHVVYHVVSDTTLVRTVGTTDATILTNMNSGNVFAYTPSVSGAQIITVTLSVHPARRPDTVLELKSEIRLRNEGRT